MKLAQAVPANTPIPLPPAPSWLTQPESERAQREWRKLSQIGVATPYEGKAE